MPVILIAKDHHPMVHVIQPVIADGDFVGISARYSITCNSLPNGHLAYITHRVLNK